MVSRRTLLRTFGPVVIGTGTAPNVHADHDHHHHHDRQEDGDGHGHKRPFQVHLTLKGCIDHYTEPCSNCNTICTVKPGKPITLRIKIEYTGTDGYGATATETLDLRFVQEPGWTVMERHGPWIARWRSPPMFQHRGWTWPLAVHGEVLVPDDVVTTELTWMIPDSLTDRTRIDIQLKYYGGYTVETLCLEPVDGTDTRKPKEPEPDHTPKTTCEDRDDSGTRGKDPYQDKNQSSLYTR